MVRGAKRMCPLPMSICPSQAAITTAPQLASLRGPLIPSSTHSRLGTTLMFKETSNSLFCYSTCIYISIERVQVIEYVFRIPSFMFSFKSIYGFSRLWRQVFLPLSSFLLPLFSHASFYQ